MKKGSKMTLEQVKRVSDGHKGQTAWNKNLKMSKEFCEKIRKANLEGRCGMRYKKHSIETKNKMSNSNKTKLLWQNKDYCETMSKSHRDKMIGKDNPAYIDGRTPLVIKVRHCWKYRLWITSIFKRDNYICQDCETRGGKLEAHHVKAFSKIWTDNKITNYKEALKCEELWDLDNGLTLCKECHKKINTRR